MEGERDGSRSVALKEATRRHREETGHHKPPFVALMKSNGSVSTY
jgi:hypothetical protein